MPILTHYGAFPRIDSEPVAYTPERLPYKMLRPFADTEMMVAHVEPLEIGETYMIGGRPLKITRLSNYEEFQEKCPSAPRFLRPSEYSFYFADPV